MAPLTLHLPMHFPARLIQLRKAADLTQQHLADAADLHVNQIRRYEAGTAQPTLDALIRLAQALHVTLDDLVFDGDERGPDDDLRLQFEAITQFTAEEKQTVRALLEGMILKHQARRWDSDRTPAPVSRKRTATKRTGAARASR